MEANPLIFGSTNMTSATYFIWNVIIEMTRVRRVDKVGLVRSLLQVNI